MSPVTIEHLAVAIGVTESAIRYRAKREAWPYKEESCRGGRRRLYDLATLPNEVQQAVARQALAITPIGEPIQAGLPSPASRQLAAPASVADGLTHGCGDEAIAGLYMAARYSPAMASSPQPWVSPSATLAGAANGLEAGEGNPAWMGSPMDVDTGVWRATACLTSSGSAARS